MELWQLIAASAATLFLGVFITWLVSESRNRKKTEELKERVAGELTSIKADIKVAEIESDRLKRELESSKEELTEATKTKEELIKGKAAAEEANKNIPGLREELRTTREKITELQSEITNLKTRNQKLLTAGEMEAEANEEKLALLEDAKQKFSDAFEALSSQALKSNNEAFLGLAKQKLDPFKQLLDDFNRHVNAIEGKREEAYGGIREQLEGMSRTQGTLKDETIKLVYALRTPQVSGDWGEVQLENAVQIAGMRNYCEYTKQVPLEAEDRTQKPDMIVNLPRGGVIIIDSKVSAKAFLDYIGSENNEEKERYLDNHVKNMRAHIKTLSKQAYWKARVEKTPEFVLMFIPRESMYFAALQKAPELIEESATKGVILAPPTTLIAVLKAVALGWREVRLAESARKIGNLGKDIYDRIRILGVHFGSLGKNLDGSVESYNKAMRSLESKVMVSARKFKELGVTTKEDIPIIQEVEQRTKKIDIDEFALPEVEIKSLTNSSGDEINRPPEEGLAEVN